MLIREERELRPYQAWLAQKLMDMPIALIAVEMSLGKTVTTLTALRWLLDTFTVRRVLIVAPLRVASDTWPDEIAAWMHTRILRFSVMTGTEKQRIAAFNTDAEIHIINRENLPWLWRYIGGKTGWKWDMLVYDESSRLKGGKKRTAKGKRTDGTTRNGGRLSEFGVLGSARKLMGRVIELTGTPAPNGVIDLWGQGYIMDLGERLGSSRTAFLKRWFDEDRYSHSIEPKDHAPTEIMDLLKDVMIGLRAEDYVDLPPIKKSIIEVRLSPKIMQEYRRFERTLVSEAYDVEAVSRGVLTNKLLQFANGSMYRTVEGDGPKRTELVHIHDEKIRALESIVEESAGQNILIAYSFKFDKERIRKRYPKIVLFDEDPNFVKNWNAGKIQMGLAHPASIGHGLNLQYGGHIQIWYGLTWSLELYDQFNRRLARPGQLNEIVHIYHILARDTADEDVMEKMNVFGANQDSVTNSVRVRILT